MYKTIIDRESFAQEVDLYQELYSSYDSLLSESDRYNKFLKTEVSRLYLENEKQKSVWRAQAIENKKQRKRLFWIGAGSGAAAVIFTLLLINP